ncbi:hypothetical protein KY342_04415 [Candidatus Woesearchaeota archaeon]|nr:hypothetical protein [Candidatus Woesearchaeota archaeon]
MGKKNKKKPKKISAKKEKYLKFKKEKPASIDISMPELTEEQIKQKREDEERINRYRFGGNRPAKEIVKRREKSKR